MLQARILQSHCPQVRVGETWASADIKLLQRIDVEGNGSKNLDDVLLIVDYEAAQQGEFGQQAEEGLRTEAVAVDGSIQNNLHHKAPLVPVNNWQYSFKG